MGEVFLGIDGGGTTTVARAERHGEVVFEAIGGPTNVTWNRPDVLVDCLRELLRGCPAPAGAAVCLAGMVDDRQHELLGPFFTERFPGTIVRFEPDYAAALASLPVGTTVAVIAGTGSVICSRTGDRHRNLVTSGGNGYMIDDYGSGFRLGQALVSRFLEEPAGLHLVSGPLRVVLGADEPAAIIRAVHESGRAVSLLSSTAPMLTEAADAGSGWAREVLAEQLAPLAAMTARHLHRYHREEPAATVGLVGGVWQSPTSVDVFTRRLVAATPVAVGTVIPDRPPVHGAVRLAMEVAEPSLE